MIHKILDALMEATKNKKSPMGLPPNGALIAATDAGIRKVPEVTHGAPHARDATDSKRVMIAVALALAPALVYGMYNVGRHAYGSIGITDAGAVAYLLEGAIHVLPIGIIVLLTGGFWEGLFAQLRGHEIAEGFLVSAPLLVMIMPPTIPWWQLVIGVSFAVVIGKEVFGGVGMNILNPALVGRAFLFFAYPAQMSGDVWIARPFKKEAIDGVDKLVANWQTTIPAEKITAFIEQMNAGKATVLDAFSGATPLAVASVNEAGNKAVDAMHKTWTAQDLFMGSIPGSIGETSTLMLLIGCVILIVTGVGAWRTMVGVFIGGYAMAWVMNFLAGSTSPDFFNLPPHEHLLMGGFALGAIFMATDPVSSPFHKTSKWIYGFLIGVLCIIIRTINPAYPEGMMLAILFMNVFAPLVDHYVVKGALKRRFSHAE
ncbi:MAG: NADH:ubiquinone reductase (Na(+)-transporting) subunit B [Deltaproteobacteria bacterium]|nr:NADH:ubiquinone reductase (Na(+)-transporting) subunit B [Deltaproteobacteria bacterium]